MTTDDIVLHYSSVSKACKAIDITKQAFYGWRKRGFIPYPTQLRYEKQSKGTLVADGDKKESSGRMSTHETDLEFCLKTPVDALDFIIKVVSGLRDELKKDTKKR